MSDRDTGRGWRRHEQMTPSARERRSGRDQQMPRRGEDASNREKTDRLYSDFRLPASRPVRK